MQQVILEHRHRYPETIEGTVLATTSSIPTMISKTYDYYPTNALARRSHSQSFGVLQSAFEKHLHKRNLGTGNTIVLIIVALVALISILSLIGSYVLRRRNRNRNETDNELELQKDEELDRKALEAQNKQWEWRGSKTPAPEWTQPWRNSQAPSDVDVDDDVEAGGEEVNHFGPSNPRRASKASTVSEGRRQWRKSTLSNQISPEDVESDAASTRSRQKRKSTLSNHVTVEDLDADVPEMPEIPSKAWRASNLSNFSRRSIAYSESEEGRAGKSAESREGRWSCAILE
jgi:hypothetical protein